MSLIREELTINIGWTSLIGTSNNFPIGWGNYFWLQTGERVPNMWQENLIEANIRFDLGGKVSALVSREENGAYAFIDDERIPSEWYYHKCCWTGGYRCSLETAQEWFTYKGDTTNELEQWTNPKEYYAKRGQELTPNGMIIIGPDIRKKLEALGYGPFNG